MPDLPEWDTDPVSPPPMSRRLHRLGMMLLLMMMMTHPGTEEAVAWTRGGTRSSQHTTSHMGGVAAARNGARVGVDNVGRPLEPEVELGPRWRIARSA